MDIKNILRANYVKFAAGTAGWITFDCPSCPNRPKNIFYLSEDGAHGSCSACGERNIEQLIRECGWIVPDETVREVAESKATGDMHEFKVWSLSELCETEFGEQDWLIDKLIPAEGLNMISGDPQNFKTWIVMLMSIAVALGKPFLSQFPVSQGVVLMIDEEDHIRQVKKRFKKLGVPPETPIRFISQSGFKVDDPRWLQLLLQEITKWSVKLVIMDSFIRIHSRKENDASDMAVVFERMRAITALGAAIILTHHHRKENALDSRNPSQSIRGSSDINAALDCHLSVERRNEGVIVSQNKLRVDEAIRPFLIKLNFTQDAAIFEYGGEMPEKTIKKEKVKELILEILKDGENDRSQLELKVQKMFAVGKNAISDAIGALEQEELIITRTANRGKKFYSLAEM